MEKNRVFMGEDDMNFGTVLKSYMEINGFNVTWVMDGRDAFKKFRESEYDICILDVMLPHIDGFTIARDIREVDKSIPLIFLTAKTLKEDIMEGFNIGADDYITKPFDSEILILKIKAILNRHSEAEKEVEPREFNIGGVHFDAGYRKLTFPDGKVIQMSPKESDLLRMLCVDKNRILSREKALKTIWGDSNYFTTRSMDVYITKLRKYFKTVPGVAIINIHGSGYQLRIKE
jgi:DNA-binding response OmpR family regulator